jgi:hypothetical protein
MIQASQDAQDVMMRSQAARDQNNTTQENQQSQNPSQEQINSAASHNRAGSRSNRDKGKGRGEHIRMEQGFVRATQLPQFT